MAITPTPGSGGFTPCTPDQQKKNMCPPPQTNFKPYIIPGQDEDKNNAPNPVLVALVKAYDPALKKPTQTSDWWASLGLQNSGWVTSRGDKLVRSQTFMSEPFQFQFIDYQRPDQYPGYPNCGTPPAPCLPAGLRIWNRNDISVSVDGRQDPPAMRNPTDDPVYNAKLNVAGYGFESDESQTDLTVGLDGVHPLKADQATPPTAPPWSNVLVSNYSDWGVTASYAQAGNKLNITMSNGSPFVWFDKTGTAPFRLWVGGAPLSGTGSFKQLFNSNGVLGLQITTFYNPLVALPTAKSSAVYIVFANKGAWTEQKPNPAPSNATTYVNPAATAVAVLAMPHNFNTMGAGMIQAEVPNLQKYACRKIVDAQFDFPPNMTTSTVGTASGGSKTVTLGYQPAPAIVTGQLRFVSVGNVAPWNAFPGCSDPAGPPLMMVFPHHRKSMIAEQLAQIIGGAASPRYKWNTELGPAYGYAAGIVAGGKVVNGSIIQQLTTFGLLPFLPSVGLSAPTLNPPNPAFKTADQEIYNTMKTWFFAQEPISQTYNQQTMTWSAANLNSVIRNVGSYDNPGTNTYIDGTITLRETIAIADQLAHDSKLSATDPQLGKSGQAVAAEMRHALLQSLKELITRWGEIFTSQLLQYNSQFNTFYGFPAGFGAVSGFNDHHFHYGYFLRAAAVIGRYDPKWLNSYLPMIDQMRMDVANFDRTSTRFPVLRNFNPFYGHSWADGTAYGAENQESTSEAMNFAAGLIELGQLTRNNNWRDLGLYMYEQEILSSQQYWFNQDANLSLPVGKCDPSNQIDNICYNGNWPSNFVTFNSPFTADGVTNWHTTTLGKVQTFFLDRSTFFGEIDTTFAVHLIPLSASLLYLGRNQAWLNADWTQYVRETSKYIQKPNKSGQYPTLGNVYVNAIAGMQALLPSGAAQPPENGTGLLAALTRIRGKKGDGSHNFYEGAVNTMGINWAYTNATLGQVDTSVIATIPNYGVFKKGGTQTCVAYNPTATALPVKFTVKSTGAAACSGLTSVPAFTMVTVGGSKATDVSGPITPPNRLYLHKASMTGDCEADTTPCAINTTPGTWLPTPGSRPYPSGSNNPMVSDYPLIQGSLVVIPIRTDGKSPIDLPPLDQVQEWSGTFSGTLVPGNADPNKNLQAVTRLAIYTNQCLNPGWQRCRVPAAGMTGPDERGNTVTVRVSYFWKATDKQPSRVEIYDNIGVDGSNTFTDNSKVSEYFFTGVGLGPAYGMADCPNDFGTGKINKCQSGFNGSFGLDLTTIPALGTRPAVCLGLTGGNLIACASGAPFQTVGNFPATVSNGKIVVDVYGGSPGPTDIPRAVPMSVEADPLTGRASWVQPPYIPTGEAGAEPVTAAQHTLGESLISR